MNGMNAPLRTTPVELLSRQDEYRLVPPEALEQSTSRIEGTTNGLAPSSARCTRAGWPKLLAPSAQPGRAGAELHSPVELAIADYVNCDYYLQAYPDVAAEGEDPVRHYAKFGWAEGRNPSPSFDTKYYIDGNPDVAEQGVNPLWHYAVAGRAEGRQPSDKAAFRQNLLKSLQNADQKTIDYKAARSLSLLKNQTLFAVLEKGLVSTSQLIVSLSHDDYLSSVGGTQIFIADEQRTYAESGADYLHLSPVRPQLRLADPGTETVYLRVILNGSRLGCTDIDTLATALAALQDRLPARRSLVCHSIMGHSVADILHLRQALQPEQAVFWVHDYAAICEGFNLLRNDVSFCGAPPPDSQACRICVYGDARARHIAQVETLFDQISFDLAAPSEAALEVWLAGSHLPVRSRHVMPHVAMELTNQRRSIVPIDHWGSPDCPIRIAFAGHPGRHKGWDAFAGLLHEVGTFPQYKFFHFSSEPVELAGVEHVSVRVNAADRDSMRRALDEHGIDLVLVLSHWPETFSYVTYEAIAAGADILTFADSGNVAAEVLRTGRGIVLDDFYALLDLFVSGRVLRYVRLCYEQGNSSGRLVNTGTTAALPMPGE